MKDKATTTTCPTVTAGTVDIRGCRGDRNVLGKLDIRIDRNGVWYYEGSPINRKEMVCLFASNLTRDAEGAYWLVSPEEMGRIEVDDVPFVAVELFVTGAGHEQVISLRTNVDELVTIDNDHPFEVWTDPDTDEPLPYVRLREGIHARLLRSVYNEVVGLGLEEKIDDEPFYGIWSCGSFFVMGRLNGEE